MGILKIIHTTTIIMRTARAAGMIIPTIMTITIMIMSIKRTDLAVITTMMKTT